VIRVHHDFFGSGSQSSIVAIGSLTDVSGVVKKLLVS
jgi:hypothetical protein